MKISTHMQSDTSQFTTIFFLEKNKKKKKEKKIIEGGENLSINAMNIFHFIWRCFIMFFSP